METIVSKDGTAIACKRSGTGSPLVLVHGTSGSHARWSPILPILEQHFTVYTIDRRGWGATQESQPYALEREFEDIAAVVDAVGENVDLLGHSFGALCSLEAARLTSNIRKLVLYEPPLPLADIPIYPEGVVERLQALSDADDKEGIVTTFMREIVRMPAQELELFKSMPAFQSRVAAAHTLPRELRTHQNYQFQSERFQQLNVPTLLLLGGDSPAFFKAAIEALDDTLPNSKVVVLPGQQHIAIDTAPELFAREVLTFLNEARDSV